MKKSLFASVALASVLVGTALSEESGVFVGAGVGAQGIEETLKGQSGGSASTSGNHVGASLLVGYKLMADNWGGRFYVNLDYNGANVNDVDGKSYATYPAVGVNADFLYNFHENFGAFVGVNLGVINWSSKLFFGGVNSNKTGLYFAPQLGLRGIFAQNHSLELAARIPVVKNTVDVHVQDIDFDFSGKYEIWQKYNVQLRYLYTF